MPTGVHKEKALLVVADANEVQLPPSEQDGLGGPQTQQTRRRHIVRYRLHPYRANNARVKEKVTRFIEETNTIQALGADDELGLDDDDMEVEINEEVSF